MRRRRFITRTRLADAVAALSVILLVCTIVLWFYGRKMTPTEIEIPGPGYGKLYISTFAGRMVVGVDDEVPAIDVFWWRRSRGGGGDLYRLVNDEDQYAYASPWSWGFAAPHWFIGLVLCVPIAWRWMVWNDRAEEIHRREHGLCRHCGYDLRASIDRCPECGEPIAMIPAENAPGRAPANAPATSANT